MNRLDRIAHFKDTPFLGLSPFLRMSMAGENLMDLGQAMLVEAAENQDNPALWMNLSCAMQCIGQREMGLEIQREALLQQRVYALPALRQPKAVTVLMLMLPGDVAANTPLDCLLEDSDIDLIFYYIDPTKADPLSSPVPLHDILYVALNHDRAEDHLLQTLSKRLASWEKPVINAPPAISRCERAAASRLLQDAPGIYMPITERLLRSDMAKIAFGEKNLPDAIQFPIIIRPEGSQGGKNLEKIDDAPALSAYLEAQSQAAFYISSFVDYICPDAQYRKMRIAVVDGQPFPCHMGISSHWMIHYLNAGMYEDAAKQREEENFMTHFDHFLFRQKDALATLAARCGLDYFCIDCAEMPDGRLLVFEFDHIMVVHAMDDPVLFPFKATHIERIKNAFRELLFRRMPAPQKTDNSLLPAAIAKRLAL